MQAGTYTSAQAVTITCATAGATIRYSMDGSDPALSPTIYSAPVSVSARATLKAIAPKSGYTDSAVTSAVYVINAPFALQSSAVAPLGTLPAKYAKAGCNVSPPFTWGAPPVGTKSLMLVCVDDNGTASNPMDDFIQWGIFNIPPTATGLAEAIAKGATVSAGVLPSGTQVMTAPILQQQVCRTPMLSSFSR